MHRYHGRESIDDLYDSKQLFATNRSFYAELSMLSGRVKKKVDQEVK